MKKTVIYTSLFAALFLAACQSNTNQGTTLFSGIGILNKRKYIFV